MIKRYITIILLFGAFLLPSIGEDKWVSALDIISKEGQLTISDGSSRYIFKKDGSFFSRPVNFDGRTIDGKWRASGGQGLDTTVQFFVEGKWSWVNGPVELDNFRTMTLWVYHPYKVRGADGVTTYKCYFVIDELKKKS